MGAAKGKEWALVLGSSSGFGAATCLELAKAGMNVFGVHLDLRSTLPNAQRVVEQVQSMGREAMFFNVNAVDPEKRQGVIDAIKQKIESDGGGWVRALVHSLAFGTLQPLIGPTPKERLSQKQMEMTLDVMASSLIYWAQELVASNLMCEGSSIFAYTSAGSTRVIRNYGAVSAAKAAIESNIRQLAFELAPLGIRANAIKAGIADTPAMRKIPGAVELYERAKERNPSGRATTPEDVGRACAALCDARLDWMTGNVINIDGGEDLTA